MLFISIGYLIGSIFIFSLRNVLRLRCEPFCDLRLTKNGIKFNSNARHRIKIGKVKIIEIENNIFIKSNNGTIAIKNVCNYFLHKEYLYFTCLGECLIRFNTSEIYKYFNIRIDSNVIDFSSLKQEALMDLVNHIENPMKSEAVRRYIKAIKTLNITISSAGVKVSKNEYDIKYTLTYKLGNRLMHIIVD